MICTLADQYTRPNRTNLFQKERFFNIKSCCGLQIPFTAHTSRRLAREKQRFREGSLSFGCVRVVIIINSFKVEQAKRAKRLVCLISYVMSDYC